MKKLLVAVAVVGGALIAIRKAAAQRSEEDLWAEATDSYS